MAKSTLHVVPDAQGWAIKREGNDRATSTHSTQKEAIEAARELAKDQDTIVVHRQDGTIRETITYSDPAAPSVPPAVQARDLVSVGSRVSWGAVAAGVVVALALYLTLSLLAFAIGLSTVDNLSGKTFEVSAAIIAAFTLLTTMFLGGYVASRTTVGEDRSEAMTYGVLVWGTMLLLLLTGGLGFGVGALGGLRGVNSPQASGMSVEQLQEEGMFLTEEQAERYKQLQTEAAGLTGRLSPQALAWWSATAFLLSLGAAIAGGWAGAGPDPDQWLRSRLGKPATT